jgi:hypothetical protein
MEEVSRVARAVETTRISNPDFRPEVIHAAAGMLLLFVVMTLSVFKPLGMTPYGQRKASGNCPAPSRSSEAILVHQPILVNRRARWGRIIGFHALALVLLLAILHITGLHHH